MYPKDCVPEERSSIDPAFALPLPHPEFRHVVAICDDDADFVERARRFVDEGVRRGQTVLVAVTAEHGDTLARSLRHPPLMRFVEIRELGRNPSRIIPAITEFVQEAEGRACRVLAEPLWRGRSRAEIDEVARHEALVDTALCECPVAILTLLPEISVLHWADTGGQAEKDEILSVDRWPLEPPPPDAAHLRFDELGAVRDHAQRFAERAGMEAHQLDDFVLAVNEVASNSIRYGGGGGMAHLWTDDGAVVCEIDDAGVIRDPLVGRRPPGPDLEAPGLWLVNQLCDLVQIRSGHDGTRIRIRVRCGASTAP